MTVHNHGTEEGKGLACRERMVNGQLKGECMSDVEILQRRIERAKRMYGRTLAMGWAIAQEWEIEIVRLKDDLRRALDREAEDYLSFN